MASQTKFVIVTPGRVAFTTAAATEKFSSKPKSVTWTPYLQELLVAHGDIQVVDPVAQFIASEEAKKTAVAPKVAPRNNAAPREPVKS